MARLFYFYIEVFGSNFDAEGFCKEADMPRAETQRSEKSIVNHPIRAHAKGNVSSWRTPRSYYKSEAINDDQLYCFDFIYEDKAIVSFVNSLQYINDILPRYRTDTTETWLHLIYGATKEEKPAGVHFGKELIDAVHRLGASITTDVVFGSIDHY